MGVISLLAYPLFYYPGANTSAEYSAGDKCAICDLVLRRSEPFIQWKVAWLTIFNTYSYIFIQFLSKIFHQHCLKQHSLRHIDWQKSRHHGNPSCHFLAEYSAADVTLYDVSGSDSLCAGRIPLLRMRSGYYSRIFSGTNSPPISDDVLAPTADCTSV